MVADYFTRCRQAEAQAEQLRREIEIQNQQLRASNMSAQALQEEMLDEESDRIQMKA